MRVVPQEERRIALIAANAMTQRKRSCFKVRRRVINNLFTKSATKISVLERLVAMGTSNGQRYDSLLDCGGIAKRRHRYERRAGPAQFVAMRKRRGARLPAAVQSCPRGGENAAHLSRFDSYEAIKLCKMRGADGGPSSATPRSLKSFRSYIAATGSQS